MNSSHYFTFVIFLSFIFGSNITINDNIFSVKANKIDNSRTIIEYTFGKYQSSEIEINGEIYYSLNLENEVNIQEEGAPSLPKIARSIIIPDDKKMSVNALESKYTDFVMNITPGKGIIVRPKTPDDIPYTFSDIYLQDEYYPGNLVQLGDPYILRDFRGITISVYPFQYNPVTKSLRIYHYLKIEVVSNGIGEKNVKDRTVGDYTKMFESLYSSHFLNYDPLLYETVEEEGRMIVISYGDFMTAVQPFVDWKNQKGIKCDLYDVYEIGANANSIMNFIQEEYDSSQDLCFVQLVGDHAQVPTILVPNAGGGGSDASFSLLEGNDKYPEIFVGRFSGSSLSHIETQVERSIFYERDITDGTWLHNGIGIGSNQGPGDDGEYDDEHLDVIREKLLNYTFSNIDAVYDPSGNDQQGIDAINEGRSIINYTGHGSTTAWGNGASLNINQVNNLVNDWKLPHVISVGCVNGAFENTTCFAEAWMRATNNNNGNPTGSVAFYGSTVNQYWNQPMRAQDHTMDLLVGYDYSSNQPIDQKHTIGGLWYNGSCNMMDVYGQSGIDMFLTWIIFGDPSLLIRSNIPEPINVGHAGTFLIGNNSYSVSTGFSDALAALSYDGELLSSGYTDASGSVVLNLSEPPEEPGEMTLTVTAYDRITNIQSVNIILPEGPYLVINSVETFTGDDSIVEYGETASLSIAIQNVGVTPAEEIIFSLNSDNPYINITDNAESLNVLEVNETILLENGFAIEVSPNVPNSYDIDFLLEITSAEYSWEADFTIQVFSPVLSINSVTILNDENANGVLDADESADVQLIVENIGHSDLDQFNLSLESANPYVEIVNSINTVNGVAIGEQEVFIFSVYANEDTPLGYNSEFILTGISDVGFNYNDSFVISVGLVLENFETGNLFLYPWEFSGESPWEISDQSYNGSFSVKSGEIFDNQNSTLSVTLDVLQEGEIIFYRKVSSAPNNDYLKFEIDTSQMGEWSGNVDWSAVAYPVSQGQHTFKWTYVKDGWDSQGDDAAWIDYIIFPTVVPPQLPVLNVSQQSLNLSALPSESDSTNFNIYNAGDEQLYYSINHTASGPRDEYEYDIPDSPDQYDWDFNTLEDQSWIEFEVDGPNISINNWTISFIWQTDWWPTEGTYFVSSPSGTTVEIANGLESGAYSITLSDFMGEQLPGIWTLWIEDSYGDGGHQASNITMSIESANPENNWLTVDTYSGIIGSGEDQNINVYCNASDLNEGEYFGTININSNDPFNSESEIEINFSVGEYGSEVSVNIISEWNMIGLPFEYQNTGVQNIYPSSVENTLFSFSETGYIPEYELILGSGYWLRFNESEIISMTGTVLEELSLSLFEGWNLISGISFPAFVDNIIDIENILIPNTLYGYSENGYLPSNIINPGYGYWIRTSSAGEIQLSIDNRASAAKIFYNKLKNINRIILNDIPLFFGVSVSDEELLYYSLPPKPPLGAKDFRFSGDSKLCATDDCVIEAMTNGKPLKLECDIRDNESWEVVDVSGNVFSCESVHILELNNDSESFILRKSNSLQAPTEFELFPAHPNPFNPETTIRFTVPKLSGVKLSIYDIQGRLVETLLNKQLLSGEHSVRWNATELSTGIYFVFLETAGKKEMQKIIYMK